MNLLKLNNICKHYGKKDTQICALNDISLAIDKGDFVAIMGTSGSGKSTLLNILGCLDTQTEGEYFINGNKTSESDLSLLRNKVFGFVFQYFALIDDYTIEENVVVPLEYTKLSKKEKKDRVIKYLTMLGVEKKINCFPRELSGGQQQRVALARALINNPDIILADEPTGALDSTTSESIMNILKKLNNLGKTIILVTHDKKIADQCKRIIFIEDGKLIKT